jgi:hypothetical protein
MVEEAMVEEAMVEEEAGAAVEDGVDGMLGHMLSTLYTYTIFMMTICIILTHIFFSNLINNTKYK